MQPNEDTHASKYVPTCEDITHFCTLTGDNNKIHSKKLMQEQGKLPVAPGMLTLAHAMQGAHEFLAARARSIDVIFGSMVSAGDKVAIGEPTEEEDQVTLYATCDGNNVLASDTERTRLYAAPGLERRVEGITRQVDISEENLAQLSFCYPSNEQTDKLLYAVFLSSNALLTAVQEPQSDMERTLHDLVMSKERPILPVYQALRITLPEDKPEISTAAPLEFTTDITSPAKRQYDFAMVCSQEGREIYNAVFELRPVPVKIILRRAKDAYKA